jgi:serine/threonine-protein phosphatase 4 regulatory subunit 1
MVLISDSFVRCLREFLHPPRNQSAFEEIFLPLLPRLAHDIVDVRLGLAQAVADLFVAGRFDDHPRVLAEPL